MRELAYLGRDVLGLLSRRFGTVFSTYLVSSGVPEDMAAQALTAVAVVGGILFDVSVAIWQDKRGGLR